MDAAIMFARLEPNTLPLSAVPMRRLGRAGMSPAVAVFAIMVVVIVAGGAYLTLIQGGPSNTTQPLSTTTSSEIEGVVTGYVTVGPSQPVCRANQTCNVDMSGYSLVFTPVCSGPTHACLPIEAALSPSGHYSILVSPGVYTASGLSPSCGWMGCSAAFPKNVTVMGGMQVVLDINIDTGIR